MSSAKSPVKAIRPSPRALTVIAVLLTFASGASDVASFTRLGTVFTSVMTGNMVIFGLSLARGSVSLASHTAVAVAGYVAGVAVGTRVMWYHAARNGGSGAETPSGEWPPHITLTLLIEMALFAVVVAGWELTGSRPAGAAQFAILVLAACAMGIQSAAVNQMGLGSVSTTYLTGTLTGLVSAIARPGSKPAGRRRPGVLIGLLAGAVLAGAFLATVPAVVPLLPLLAVAAVVALGSGRVQPPPLPTGVQLPPLPTFPIFHPKNARARPTTRRTRPPRREPSPHAANQATTRRARPTTPTVMRSSPATPPRFPEEFFLRRLSGLFRDLDCGNLWA